MRHQRQLELLRRLEDAHPATCWPLAPASLRNPASAYVDPARFVTEQRVLFRRQPQLVALSCEVRDPGQWLALTLGGVPVVIVRQRDGSLRGFVNACRHRGAPLVDGDGGPRPRLMCPYHGWVYELDGTLHSQPYAEPAFDDVPRSSCTLRPVSVAEGHGLVFAQVEGGDGLSADAALHGAEDEIADYGLGDYVPVESNEQVLEFNWKLFLDTFCEAYHFRSLHANSIAPVYLCDVTLFDAFGPHPRLIGLLKSVRDELAKADEDARSLLPHATTQYIFMPSGLLVYQRDHVELWRATPLAVDRTQVRLTLYAREAPVTDKARAYWQRNMAMLLEVTGREDFPMMRRIQATLASGALPDVVYGRNESALIHLHASINRLLAEADAAA